MKMCSGPGYMTVLNGTNVVYDDVEPGTVYWIASAAGSMMTFPMQARYVLPAGKTGRTVPDKFHPGFFNV
ncbi:hypothetical protein A6M21_13585 [Desulfotomaculum copahuensis]|uniref:Uncharacterized protein n=1 Tax=Desulfotomaculum copahuensis TaxID=1838280 RepID=A0A1B7LCE5_9FIRM|nr:hypothetical protein A6M21_13585 [Desulfotomaculum copahuensis]